MIDENHLRRVGDPQSVTAHETDDAAVLQYGIITVVGLLHDPFDIRQEIERLEADGIIVHNAPNGHTLIDEARYGIGIIRCREDEDTARLRFLQSLRRNAAVPGHDKAGNPLVNTGQNRLGLSVAHEHDVVPFDDLLNRCDTSGSDADLSLDCLRLITGDKHLTVGGMNDVAIAYAHIREIRHAELLKIPLRKITDRNDADEKSLAVRHGN